MIAIFLISIAVLDVVHILTMFFDQNKNDKDRKKTLLNVMSTYGHNYVSIWICEIIHFAGHFKNNRKIFMKSNIAIIVILLVSTIAMSAELSGLEIMQKSLKTNYYSGLDRMTEGKMTITDKNNNIRESVPKDSSKTEFSYFKTWVQKTTFLALKKEYYDINEALYREIKVKNIDDIPTIISSTLKDLNTGRITQVQCSDVKYNVGVDLGLFSERFLRNPPSQWFN